MDNTLYPVWKSDAELVHEKHPSLLLLTSKNKVDKLKQRWNEIDFDDKHRAIPEWLREEEIECKPVTETKKEKEIKTIAITKPKQRPTSRSVTTYYVDKCANSPHKNEYNQDIIGHKNNKNDINELEDYSDNDYMNKNPEGMEQSEGIKKKVRKTSRVKEWKPMFNAAANSYKKREMRPSLIMLRSKGMLSGGLNRDDTKKDVD